MGVFNSREKKYLNRVNNLVEHFKKMRLTIRAVVVLVLASCLKKNQASAVIMSGSYGELHYSGNFESFHVSSSGSFVKIKVKPKSGGKFSIILSRPKAG